jgi:predicted  nucleic acid-binding Zn-ribbon protein
MDWLKLTELLTASSFFQQLTLVAIVIASIRSHVKKIETSVDGIRSELHDLKGIFRDHNKRISNIEGTVEAIRYEVFELQTDVKNLKK